jgi:hypothetical protein
VFAKEGPDAGEVGDVDCDGGFACVPEHVRGGVDIAEIIDFGEYSGDNLEEISAFRSRTEECDGQHTTNVPILKSRPRPIFCLIGSARDAIIGIGTAMMRRSLLMLKVACTMAKCSRVVHCGLTAGTLETRSQCVSQIHSHESYLQ